MAEDPAPTAAEVPTGAVSAPPPPPFPIIPPAGRPGHPRLPRSGFPRPRLLPWTGLLLLVICLTGLLRTAPPPRGSGGPANPRPRAPLTSPGHARVILDAGHGGADTGAVAGGQAEKDLTLDLAKRVAASLGRKGVATQLTREDDTYVPLGTRARIANATPRAVFVSIHLNHAATGASGIETFYSQQKEPLLPPPASAPARLWRWAAWFGGGEASTDGEGDARGATFFAEDGLILAGHIQTALVAGTSAVDRGVKERGLYVTRRVQGPAVLVEGGFLSNSTEARLLADPAYRQRLAEAIANGILEFLHDGRRRGAAAVPGPVRHDLACG